MRCKTNFSVRGTTILKLAISMFIVVTLFIVSIVKNIYGVNLSVLIAIGVILGLKLLKLLYLQLRNNPIVELTNEELIIRRELFDKKLEVNSITNVKVKAFFGKHVVITYVNKKGKSKKCLLICEKEINECIEQLRKNIGNIINEKQQKIEVKYG